MGSGYSAYVPPARAPEELYVPKATSAAVVFGPIVSDSVVQQLDCKDFAHAFATHDRSLVVVRGYFVNHRDRDFSEHWWCSSGGSVVDVTGLAALKGAYLPLKERLEIPR